MKYVRSLLLALFAIGAQLIFYALLPWWLADGELSPPVRLTLLIFLPFTIALSFYFAFARYDYLVSRILPMAQDQPWQDRVLSALVALALVGGYLFAAAQPKSSYQIDSLFGGALLLLLGVLLLAWTMWVNPFSSMSLTKHPKHQLVRRGPYRWVRHPMYSSILLVCLSWGFMFQHQVFWLVGAVCLIALALRIPLEEEFLCTHLEGYDAYRRSVRWRLLPPLW